MPAILVEHFIEFLAFRSIEAHHPKLKDFVSANFIAKKYVFQKINAISKSSQRNL